MLRSADKEAGVRCQLGTVGRLVKSSDRFPRQTAPMRGRGPAVDDITLTTGRLGLENDFRERISWHVGRC